MTINSIFNQGFTNPFTKIKQSTQNILDTSTNIADDNLNTLTRTQTGTSESIEIDLSKSVNLEELQSIVVYTSNDTYDPSFNKIKLESLNNIALDISEIQIWVDNSNIAPNSTITYSSLINSSNNMISADISNSTKTNTGIGEYLLFEIPYTNYRNLEAVVIYDSSNGEFYNRKITLLNNTESFQEISFDNSTNSQNIFTKITKIKGGSYNPKVKKLKKLRFETTKNSPLTLSELQIWSENNNITQNNSTISTSELVTPNSIFDQSLNSSYQTGTGIGKYIDLTLTNQVDVSQIQGIVAYTEIDSSRNPIILKILPPIWTLTSHKSSVLTSFLKYCTGTTSNSSISCSTHATFCACLLCKDSRNSSTGQAPDSVR